MNAMELLKHTEEGLRNVVNVHREETMSTCPDTCWCWEVDCIANNIECHMRQILEDSKLERR